MGYYDRQTPPSAREEAWAEAQEAAHEARCAAVEQEVMASADTAAEVIFDALGLEFDPATAFTAGDADFLRAVAAVYVEARGSFWQTATPAQKQLVRVLEKSLQNVIDAHIREADRIAHNRAVQRMRGAA